MKNLSVDGLHINIEETGFKQFPRSALSLINADKALISGVSRIPATGTPPIVEQTDCKEVNLMPRKTKV